MFEAIVATWLAAEDPEFVFEIYTSKDDVRSCKLRGELNETEADAARISIVVDPKEPKLQKKIGTQIRLQIDGTLHASAQGEVQRADAKEGKVEVAAKVGTDAPISCGVPTLFAEVSPRESVDAGASGDGESGGASSSGATPMTRHDGSALAWWAKYGRARRSALLESLATHGRGSALGRRLRRGDGRGAVLVVHLPSGAPAAPFPSSVREGTVVQVAVIRPTTEQTAYDLEIESCASIEPFRTTFDEAKAAEEKAGKAKKESLTVEDAFELVPIGQWMRCGAGPLEYSLKPSKVDGAGYDDAAAARTKIRVRPVYHLAATAIVGFDSSKLPSFGLRSVDDGMGGTTNQITGSEEFAGARVLVGAQWMIGGVDYEEMRWYNYFANLFVAVNVARPLDSATVGLALTPTGGASIAVGLSLSKSNTLQKGLQVGDTLDGEGDVPVELTWKEPAVGAFVGIAIDHRIYQALVAKFK